VELAALIALPLTLAYAFGVVALWVQLSTRYQYFDAWSYWYAATLAPKPVVAGLGVRVLIRAFSLSLLIGGVSLLVAWPFVRRRRKRRCPADHGPYRWTLVLPVLVISIAFFLVPISFSPRPRRCPAYA
jgi:hypothetical protein